MRSLFLFIFTLFLTACATETVYAPVTDISTIEKIPRSGVYRVLPDDTLYSIAWRYGLDYRTLVKINHISPPYHILTGQIIYLRQNNYRKMIVREKVKPRRIKTTVRIEVEPTSSVLFWGWPAKGSIIGTFSGFNKGINIRGLSGDPIQAAAPGKVVYAGDGLKAYGNLIIIKHNSTWFSAYAHNKINFVKEGQFVKRGEKIALMGDTGTNRNMLHFEIRRGGKPVNPLSYLKKQARRAEG